MISIAGLEKRFKSRQGLEQVALQNVDLEIGASEFFCLLGPSGCGKTTVLNILAGFERPTRGTVTMNGPAIAQPGADRAVVFQGDDSLFNWLTALQNIEKVLLMDEPFAALDAQTRLLMQEQLARIWQRTKTSVLFVTHDIDEAIILGTRVGVMRAGPAANIKATVDVKLDNHRSRTNADFMRIYAQVYEMIREEVLSAMSNTAPGEQTP